MVIRQEICDANNNGMLTMNGITLDTMEPLFSLYFKNRNTLKL